MHKFIFHAKLNTKDATNKFTISFTTQLESLLKCLWSQRFTFTVITRFTFLCRRVSSVVKLLVEGLLFPASALSFCCGFWCRFSCGFQCRIWCGFRCVFWCGFYTDFSWNSLISQISLFAISWGLGQSLSTGLSY